MVILIIALRGGNANVGDRFSRHWARVWYNSLEDYLRQMRTQSNIRTLAGERRSRLLANVREFLDQVGGFIERSHEAVLYLNRVL